MLSRGLPVLLLALILAGCANLFHRPSTHICEERAAQTATSQRLLVLADSINWSSSMNGDKYEITLPQGVYHMQARDDDYWYFEAPDRVTLGTRKLFPDQDKNSMDGGIFISRNASSQYSAGAYVDSKHGTKLLLFFFDSRFTKQEGEQWHYVGE